MRIAIMGAGGLGGLFGGLLARSGADVTFIARGANLAALQNTGLAVRSAVFDDFTLPVRATDRPADVGPVDLVLFCVKQYDVDEAATQIRPLVGTGTLVLPLQNGVDAAERIARRTGPDTVLNGLTWTIARLDAPGVIVHTGGKAIQFGEPGGGTSERSERVAEALRQAGIDAQLDPNIQLALWKKYAFFFAGSGLSALTRLSYGQLFRYPETFELYRGLMAEVIAVAQARGIELTQEWADEFLANTRPRSIRNWPMVYPSMYHNLMAGKPLEIEHIHGYLVREGQRLGIPTPLTSFVYAALTPYRDGPPATPDH